jgi:putative protease
MSPPKKPELMSPAGHWQQLQTAIEAGADAVYFGLNHFSARAKVGFSVEELPEVMETLHGRGVKGFVTFNTLVFDHELEAAIIEIAHAGVDAVIVQDVGIAQLVKRIAPELEVHGSTQMSITSAQGAELAQSLGCNRVVLGRELSLADIRKIADATDVELEVFVHGALCVSYSGQCFSSEAWGGRSANRGKCAQACRLSYDLIVDGHERDLGEFRYLLSPGDLYALEQIPELIEIGISCVKIEGRYKDADYVALTTRAYREAIDLACLELPIDVTSEERLELEQIYSRGLGPHFIGGVNHQTAVRGRAPRHRGVQVGEIMEVKNKSLVVRLEHAIKRGDGLVFDSANWRSPDEPEEGGSVYEVTEVGAGRVELEFGHGEIDFLRIRVGDLVWRSKDPKLNKSLKPLTTAQAPVFTRPIRFEVTAKGGLPIEIVAKLKTDLAFGELTATYVGEHPLTPAEKRPLDLEMLTDKLGRLGGTPFHVDSIELLTTDPVFVRTSELNNARRQLVDELFEESGKRRPLAANSGVAGTIEELKAEAAERSEAIADQEVAVQIHLLVRTPEQLDAAIESAKSSTSETGVASITLDYLELYGLRPSVEKIHAAGIRARVASPRILKPAEQKVIRFLTSLGCDIVVRSGGLLHDLISNEEHSTKEGVDLSKIELIGDFSLNAANGLSCQTYLDMGLARITPTYDLNSEQIADLTQLVPAANLEIIAYSHLPVFHTEHCVFCRFLSEGTDNTNCGHPCEKHQIAVRDSQGRAHPVMADVGCRNTVFGAEAQVDPQSLALWTNAGIANFRLEFVHQTPDQVNAITSAFREYFDGTLPLEDFEKTLAEQSPQQTTAGSFYIPSDFKNLVELK